MDKVDSKRISTILVAFLVGFMAVFTTYKSQGNDIGSESESHDQSSSNSHNKDGSNYLITENQAISSIVQVSIIYDPQLLMNIEYNEDNQGEYSDQQNTDQPGYFKCLFERIISPNAP